MYVGRSKSSSKGKQLLVILLVFLLIWLIASMIFNRSPLGLITGLWKSASGDSDSVMISYKDLEKENKRKDSIILELNEAITMMKKSTAYQQAVVNVESDNLNMRDQPSLNSEIVIQLPVGSVVEVLYYDRETYRIGGEYGKWCKVKFAGQEGWVWGNYIKLIE